MTPHETLERLRSRIDGSRQLSESAKEKLLAFVKEVDGELTGLEGEEAGHQLHSALNLTDAVALESDRATENRDVFHKTLDALNASLTELEIRHPRIAQALAGIGRSF
ncbi:MAG: hypothetical protein WBE58_02640 [Verrucomicrobiales bacterium]